MTHFVMGKDQNGKLIAPQEKPETTFTQPSWFTKLLPETKILCSLMSTCPSIKSFAFKVNQPPVETLAKASGDCASGLAVPGEAAGNLGNPHQQFTTQSWVTRMTETVVDAVRGTTTTTVAETTSLRKKSRAPLMGGKTLVDQTNFTHNFLPAEIIQPGNGPLTSQADFYVSPDFSIHGEQSFNYPLAKSRREFCLMICATNPQIINITASFPFCPSCNPKDYPLIPNYDQNLGTSPSD